MKNLNLFCVFSALFSVLAVNASTTHVPLVLECYEMLDGQRGGIPGILFGDKVFDFEVDSVESESVQTCPLGPLAHCGTASGFATVTEYHYAGTQTYAGEFNFSHETSRVIAAKLSFFSESSSYQTNQPLKSFSVNSVGVHGVEPFTGVAHDAADYRKPETFTEIICQESMNVDDIDYLYSPE